MQSQDIKYLGLGFGIGAAIAGMAIGVVFLLPRTSAPKTTDPLYFVPIPVIYPTLSGATPTNTNTPNPPTSIITPPEPTNTPSDMDLLMARGEIVVIGPLDLEQTTSLYKASMSFIAPTLQESKVVATEINRQQFSDPSTTCGPLSIAILQTSGLLGDQIIPHDFFLLNPDNGLDRKILERAFPEELFSQTRYKIKLNKVNWTEEPLFPGDFLYIYMGSGGNFEHMLVVNRVDHAGRAYSVTNFNTENGFIIDEVLLYDPNDSGAGIFIQWTRREKQLLGSTGFAGYEVWRRRGDSP